MSFFGSLFNRILGHANAATPTDASAPNTPASEAVATAALAGTATAMQGVDVAAVLGDMASKAGQKLNWETSIVDLMKLVGLDSSLANRQALAKELAYTGDMGDSAGMNIWLHKQVMAKLAANGGKLPANLAA